MEPRHQLSLPFRHVPDVGYVTNHMADLMHKLGTQGSCAQVARVLGELKYEEHFKTELIRARLMAHVRAVEEKVWLVTGGCGCGW